MGIQKEFERFLKGLLEDIPLENRESFIEEFNKLSLMYDKRFSEINQDEYMMFFLDFLKDVLEIYKKYYQTSTN